jgi:Protein of unknown function (DUF1573)
MSKRAKNVILILFLAGLGASVEAQTPPAPGAAARLTPASAGGTNAIGPKIRFATPIYDFGKIRSGESVKYTYVFTNIGDQALEISNVHPQCGCTTAGEYSKSVQPGSTGTIPIEFHSGNYPAGQVLKMTTVTCNDKSQPTLMLQLKGTVWKPVELIPSLVWLNLPPDVPSGSMVVRIINNTQEPMTVEPPTCTSKAFALRLTNTVPGKEYQLTISVVPPLHVGQTPGQVMLKTSSTNAPTLTLPVYANVQPAITVVPSQIPLPPPPLPNRYTPSITIQNNGTNALTLSEPAFSVAGVEVQLHTIQTGRVYNVALSFPPGFEVPQGQQAVFTVKTSRPQYPVIRVPFFQMRRTANRPVFHSQPLPVPPVPANRSQQAATAARATPASLPPLPPGH